MRDVSRAAKLCALLPTLLIAPGCLSLGGTTYSGQSPETDARLSSLESRVGHLEEALHMNRVPTPTSMPLPMGMATDSP